MEAASFAYWLQGFFELAKPESLTPEQTKLVKQHLALVFAHDIDPRAGPPEVQAKLNEIHGTGETGGVLAPASGRLDGVIYRC